MVKFEGTKSPVVVQSVELLVVQLVAVEAAQLRLSLVPLQAALRAQQFKKAYP
jgi:hypothetical protein